MMNARTILGILWLMAPLDTRIAMSQTRAAFDGFSLVDKSGNIRLPADFSRSYESLGVTWELGQANADQMRSSYASPGAIDTYFKTGRFADGTVLVRQVVVTESDRPSPAAARSSAGATEWFVMIKDGKGRYPGNPLWGNGWGWALFKSNFPQRQVAVDFRRECLGCHTSAQQTDWVFVKEHPALSNNHK